MPDTGHCNPHTSDNHSAPTDWHAAFAALPAEAPTPDGWQRLHARLPIRTAPRRARWPWGLAMAAALALAVVLPWRLLAPGAARPAADVLAVTDAGAIPTSTPMADPALADTDAARPIVDSAPPPAPKPTLPARDTRLRPASIVRGPPRARHPPAANTATAHDPAAAATDTLNSLYARSAQLEDLLALARDDRVANGPAAALADDLETQLATVDAALSQPGLSRTQRAALWSTRVDALQQLVGIETTQRLYVARGQSHAAALVTID
jgi:hypothetical protein